MQRLSTRLSQNRPVDNTDPNNPLLHKPKLLIGRAAKHYTILNSELVELGRFSELESIFTYVKKVIKTKIYPGNKISNAVSKVDKETLWCTRCIDDPLVTVCIYCGCQVCVYIICFFTSYMYMRICVIICMYYYTVWYRYVLVSTIRSTYCCVMGVTASIIPTA